MESLLYLAAIVVIVALGFAFAVWLSMKGIRDGEQDWAARAATVAADGHETAMAGSGVHQAH